MDGSLEYLAYDEFISQQIDSKRLYIITSKKAALLINNALNIVL